MAFNGSGTFLINTAGQPVVSGTVISSTAFNALTADLATGLSTAITKDGQTTVTANIPMSTYKFTGLGVGSAATDSANLSQVQSTVTKLLNSVSGADTITATASPTLAAYAAGQMFYFVAAGDNTTSVTLNIDSLGAKAVTRDGSTALVAADIKSGEVIVVVYDGTRFQVVSQLNSAGNATFANVSITSALNVGGVATFSAGTAAAPSITTTGDTNTGIFFPAADTIAFTEGGTESLRVNSSGNMGIGTTSPGSKLDVRGVVRGGDGTIQTVISYTASEGVTGTISNHAYVLYANNADRARIDTSGRFGIGTEANTLTNVLTLYRTGSTQSAMAAGNSNTGLNGTLFGVDTAGNGIINQTQVFATIFSTSNTERMRLDSSGNLGIGTASPGYRLHVAQASGNDIGFFGTSAGGGGRIVFSDGNSGTAASVPRIGANGNDLLFYTNTSGSSATERARITSGGDLCVGSTSALGKLDVYQTALARAAYFSVDNASNTSNVLRLDCTRNTTNSSYDFLLCAVPGVATRLTIADSGNVANTNGTYGTISDQRLKQDIVDAGSQWDDLKAVRFRKYRMKTDVQANPDSPAMLGVVAQELEAICPGLVENRTDRDDEGNDLGTVTKTVKSSILLMKAAVALQEAMARIETLEAKVTALESK